jgi:hypothetical protein
MILDYIIIYISGDTLRCPETWAAGKSTDWMEGIVQQAMDSFMTAEGARGGFPKSAWICLEQWWLRYPIDMETTIWTRFLQLRTVWSHDMMKSALATDDAIDIVEYINWWLMMWYL